MFISEVHSMKDAARVSLADLLEELGISNLAPGFCVEDLNLMSTLTADQIKVLHKHPARIARKLFCLTQLAARMSNGRPITLGDQVTTPEDVVRLCDDISRESTEHFVLLVLDARHRLKARIPISIGSMNASIVHPREVFRHALIQQAASIVVVHNHPSGDPAPSDEDFTLTRRLKDIADLHGIGLLDHVILAPGRKWTSLREMNRMEG